MNFPENSDSWNASAGKKFGNGWKPAGKKFKIYWKITLEKSYDLQILTHTQTFS
jgi:hypothetical protein